MTKIAVIGQRQIKDDRSVKFIFDKLDYLLSNKQDIEIVQGGAKGVDSIAYMYAVKKNYKFKLFPAKWLVYGKQAGYLRNIGMIEYCDVVVAFWDGKSKGTKHMIDNSIKRGLDVRVYNMDEN